MLPLVLPLLRSYAKPLLILAAVASLLLAGKLVLNSAEQRGWNARDAIAVQQAGEAELRAAEIVRANTEDAAQRSATVITKILLDGQAAADRSKSLSARLARQEATPFNPTGVSPHAVCNLPDAQPAPALADVARPLLGQSVLDVGTVRLLNEARLNAQPGDAPGGPTPGTDAQSEAAAAAPTPITGRIFADNDLQVVGLYHELAARHDGLVDWVNHQCAPQKPQ